MGVSQVRTSAGTTFSLCATLPATYSAAGFEALSYTVVGEVVDIGNFGKKYNLVSFAPLGDRKIVKRKGSYNNGTMSIKLGASVTDPGQKALLQGSTSDTSYAFKVTTQALNSYYFTGQIMSFVQEFSSVDTIMGVMCDIELDNDVMPQTATLVA